MKIEELLRFMVQQEASDLHIKPMRPPLLRINGKLLPLKTDPLHPDLIRDMCHEILSERELEMLEDNRALDFGYSVPGVSRFRASLFYQRGTLSGVFRRVPFDFPTLEEWGLPTVLNELAELSQGLVLVTGPTGSGKSSTLAALMRLMSDTRLAHIVTIEDPIEFLLKDNLGAVTQREIGTDTPGFGAALRNALRQDPDIIMVGEMRDIETTQTVLQAAETGHLVLSTLHTNSAVQTLDRILDMFPSGQHRQVRQQLSSVLSAIISLRLVDRADGSGLTAAVEILRWTPRVSKLILEGNLEALYEEMENSVSYYRMQSMNQSLTALVAHKVVTKQAALDTSTIPDDLDLMLRKLLYSSENGDGDNGIEEGDLMAESLSDFSKIEELQEIKKLYDELQEKMGSELNERDEEIRRLSDRLSEYSSEPVQGGESERLQQENDRLNQQIQLIRQEYDAKIERLNARVRDLSGGSVAQGAGRPAPEAERKGFFRR
ncbi:MAG: PilT/PilU family type 4a pilus ATPase [Acidobacteria bacterium]|uniref:PilT/PilU family type 4a pilus ATPase n=1 Tax=Candidatus Polarisedimenticola svalbardensis TaxID=2886004 RepID=A0A8J7CJT2_9BACT|nr:PilT/PilU family type 4a pilus ATPase [Candidatus Polarisedimenticola svalbardensis]